MSEKLNSISTLKKLWPFIRPFKKALIFAIIGLLLNAATDATLISLTKPLLDHGLMDKNYSLLIAIAIAIIGLILLRGLSNYLSTYCLSWLSGKVVTKFRQMIFNHLIRCPTSYHDKQSVGDLVSILTYNTQMLSKASSDALIIIIREITYAVGLCIVMLYGSWKLASVLIVLVPLIIFIAQFIAKKFRQTIALMQQGMGQITIASDEMLKGHKEVLIFNAKKYEKRNFDNVTLRELTSLHVELQKGAIACESLFGIMNSPLEKDHGTIVADKVKGDIEFKNVTYTYPTRSTPALNDISLKITAGQTIALVGRSGAGKSTIASLLPRFYDVTQGEILLDSINIQQYTLSSLRKQIGYVSQNVHLFNGTIAENIAYGEKELHSKEDIINAAKFANALEFIDKLEQGIDTEIGDNGILLSGGQRQRIAIARVLLRNNPILIFDEATSALDNESEKLVQNAIEILQKNRTSIIIAHRLSTIEKADRILVIDDGKVLEDGNHQSLINLNGIYAQMHKMQFNSSQD